MRAALVHDWLTGMRGGERVLEALLELVPGAEIFTLVHCPGSVSEALESRPIHTSYVDRLPGGRTFYRHYLPLLPHAVGTLDLSGFDLVVSTSHCVAKGVAVPGGVPHLSYVHTPMRYVWDQYDAYFGRGRASLPVRVAAAAARPALRAWDVRSARAVDRFVANSSFVRERIRRYWGRDAEVVHPPVELDRFRPVQEKDDYYLMLGALAPYKRVDVAVEAFRRLGRPLVVAGAGRARRSLAARAGPGTVFTGCVADEEVVRLLARARGLVLPGVEDFGITVAEALASGTPVIAAGTGGQLDLVREPGAGGEPGTGVLMRQPGPDGLVEAVRRFEGLAFRADALACSVAHLGRERFLEEMRAQLHALLEPATPEEAPS